MLDLRVTGRAFHAGMGIIQFARHVIKLSPETGIVWRVEDQRSISLTDRSPIHPVESRIDIAVIDGLPDLIKRRFAMVCIQRAADRQAVNLPGENPVRVYGRAGAQQQRDKQQH
ncbi:hypothetical protein GCM10010971_30040 [Silvimonas amylolytica]|uniref:Uncharacterized protein n=1 Tax=Silvimonas amylolytica TaxID=449663 RepID=A0ABQ2PNJ1_9NEIS|nr:hypothetical protein GCM10010971_30040 [Silvimonas amylolytica]